MSASVLNQAAESETADPSWKSLYKIGGIAAFIATVLFVSDIVVLVMGGTMPSSASAWFALFQSNRVAGLLQLFFSDLVGVALMAPIFLALYMALRQTNKVYAALAVGFAFIGITAVFATNANYSLLYLSNQHAAATTEAQKAQFLAAAESVLATNLWGTGFIAAGLFIEGAYVILSVVMLQTKLFSRRIAYLGLVAHGLDVVHTIVLLLLIPLVNPDVASSIGGPLLAIGGTLQLIWYPLIARRLWQLGRLEKGSR